MSTLIIVVWSTMLSALKDIVMLSSTSSESGFGIEVFSVVVVSGLGSSTFTIAHISTDEVGTIIIIPEVVRSQWSPDSVSSFSVDETFIGDLEFTSYLNKSWNPWST